MEILSGVRVLEMASVIAGPYSGAILESLGAEVTKIEMPNDGDALRKWMTPRGPVVFDQMNAGKKSIAIDLSTPRGPEVVRHLISRFDVLLQNHRPGRMEAWGLSAEDCLALNPRLVYVSVTGFGGKGPLGDRPGYDGIGQAFGGLLGLLTGPGLRPAIGPALADLCTGLVCAAGAVMGLYSRERTGAGLTVETSLLESIIALIADQFNHQQGSGAPQDFGSRARRSQIYSLRTQDDRYIVVHVSTSEKFFRSLAAAAERKDLLEDERFETYAARTEHFDELHAELESTTTAMPLDQWLERLAGAGVPHSPVMRVGELLEHPQLAALGLFSSLEQRTGLRLVGTPWRFNGVRPGRSRATPGLSEHGVEILREVFSLAEIEELGRDGVVQLATHAASTEAERPS